MVSLTHRAAAADQSSTEELCALLGGSFAGRVQFVGFPPNPTPRECHADTTTLDIYVADECDNEAGCCLELLVDCNGTGQDVDLLPITVACGTIRASEHGAIAHQCVTNAGTVEEWHVHGDKLEVQGKFADEDDANEEVFEIISAYRRPDEETRYW
ncbi:hypothetical protein ACA910_004557 [Epithemia clementina (nom. ined.)]